MKNLFEKASKKMPDLFGEHDDAETEDTTDSEDGDATECANEFIKAVHSEDAEGVIKALKELIAEI